MSRRGMSRNVGQLYERFLGRKHRTVTGPVSSSVTVCDLRSGSSGGVNPVGFDEPGVTNSETRNGRTRDKRRRREWRIHGRELGLGLLGGVLTASLVRSAIDEEAVDRGFELRNSTTDGSVWRHITFITMFSWVFNGAVSFCFLMTEDVKSRSLFFCFTCSANWNLD